MKTKLNITVSIFLLGLLFISGCRKEIQDKPANAEAGLQAVAIAGGGKDECQLVFATNSDATGIFDFTFHYNERGLADEWYIENYGLFKQEYDTNRKLKKSVLTVNGEVSFSTRFIYNGDELVKAVYYDATGTVKTDVAYYKYNAQGKLAEVQSFMNDYLATAKYSPQGNLLESHLFFSGIPFYSLIYSYNQQYKNPYLQVPGIDNAFPYYTPADFFSSKLLYASLKQIAYDENSNPIVLFEYNPAQTLWQADPQNCAGSATYFDVLSSGWFPYKYQFENCGCSSTDNYSNPQILAQPNASSEGKINPMMLLKRNPAKTMKEQVAELRQQLKNIKK